MANPVGARKDGSFKAISTAPSINKTPQGPAMVPVGYPVVSSLDELVAAARNVRFNLKPLCVFDQSEVPACTGDEAGTGKGVRSGTVSGKGRPTAGAPRVRANGRRIVRHGDPAELQGGNCPGRKPTRSTNPPVRHETDQEREASRGKASERERQADVPATHPWERRAPW
jgi:hypothetical protein